MGHRQGAFHARCFTARLSGAKKSNLAGAPQRLKPRPFKAAYRSGEPLRHPNTLRIAKPLAATQTRYASQNRWHHPNTLRIAK
jgi:hypothetical protein